MTQDKWRWCAGLFLCGLLILAGPRGASEARANAYIEGIGVETSSLYKIKVEAPVLTVYETPDADAAQVDTLSRDQICTVTEYDEDGWVRVEDEAASGYVKLSEGAILVETAQEKVNEKAFLRDKVVQYALQFLGGKYVWGGTDPHTGVDCSGFTAYIMKQIAGIHLSHGSVAQSGEGRKVKTPQPGDLVFYSTGGAIDHVAIYIGDGKVVHASSKKTGIKISKLNHRPVVKCVDVLAKVTK